MNYINELEIFCTKNKIRYSTYEELKNLNLCTYAENLNSIFSVFPSNNNDIQLIINKVIDLKTSNPQLSIYSVSQGLNLGYGSATPTSQNSILMNLSNYENSISWVGNKFDKPDNPYGKKLGIVRVTTSVTQQQLYDFLQSEGGHFWMDATGAPTNSSIVGNYLERGFGHTKMGDHFRHVVGMEVILPDGSFIKTGHAGCNNASNIGIHKHGIGPILEGLFSQSNLGIVTAIYLELMPSKKFITKFFIQLNSDNDFFDAVEQIQPLKMNDILSSQMHCGNSHKGIQAVTRYPFKETNWKTPLPILMKYAICQEFQISPWTISGAIYADSWVEMKIKTLRLKKALKSVNCKTIILSEWFANAFYKIFNSLLFGICFKKIQKKMLPKFRVLNELIKLKKGIPTNYFIKSVYWRKRVIENNNELNPNKDNVGMIWIAPIAPMTKENIKQLVEISTSISEEYNFEPAISITLLNDKAADCILSIVFDRDFPDEEQNALQCYDKLISSFNEIGFTSYRASTRSMIKNQLNYSDELINFHKRLKSCIDPNNLFSPNHYLY